MDQLGRFGHHPDPAIDFCVEVDDIEETIANILANVATIEETAYLHRRINSALQFVARADPWAIKAKRRLREIANIPEPPFPV